MLIEKSLKITIKQADVELAIKELIKKEDPTIVVDTISFQPKRSGTDSIGITVGAHFADEEPEEPTGAGTADTGEQVVEPEEDLDPPFTPDEESSEEEEISPKQGLFS